MENKIEIRLFKVYDAGMYEIRTSDVGIGDDMILKLSSGCPFKSAMRDAERLAVMIDCDLYLDDKIIREKIKD